MIKFYTSMPDVEVGYGSKKHKAALSVKTVSQMDSKGSVQLQLADLLVSSINYYYISLVKEKPDKFSDSIIDALEGKILVNSMWPSLALTPEELDMTGIDGINSLDFFSDHAKRNPEAYRKARPKKKDK